MNLIDKDELMRNFTHNLRQNTTYTTLTELRLLLNLINNAKIVTELPTKNAEWKLSVRAVGRYLYGTCICSSCHNKNSDETNYCPNCGAKMLRKDKGIR